MTDTAARTTTWTIDPVHTAVEFAVKHMMFATARGRFTEVSGTFTLDNEAIENSTVNVEIDAQSVTTNDEKRDGHLRSADFFDVENFPTLTFQSTKVERASSNNYKVTGDLTIRGVTRPAVLDVEVHGEGVNPWGQKVLGAAATTKVNRKDFGLNWNAALESGGVLVSDEVKIAIDLEANA